MIKKIYIKNFATIDFLEVGFCENLNVLSGETGAGKSIIIESLNFLFGKTKGEGVIRTGEKEGYVSAVFDALSRKIKANLAQIFEENGINFEEDEDIIVKRAISINGKSKYFINNEPVNKTAAERLEGSLVNIFGQNDKRFLISNDSQLAFLDEFAENIKLLSDIKGIYNDISRLESEKEKVKKKIGDISRIKTLNTYIIDDVEKLEIKSENDDIILQEELKRLENINSIKEYISASINLIDNEEYGILKNLTPLVSNLLKLADVDSNFKKTEEFKNAESAKILIEDILLFLEKYADFEFDEQRLSEIRLKIDRIISAENKYSVSGLKELIDLYNKAKIELESVANLEERVEELENNINGLKDGFLGAADVLHKRRTDSASVLEKKIEAELSSLGIKPVFKIELNKLDFKKGFSETGLDECKFMFSANPGEDPKPLSMVASGGELSRLSLCMLKIVNVKKGSSSFIFDEVDSGIGGDVANFVGEALKNISDVNQVILVTHLAQVASFAGRHLFVYKEVINGKTYTKIRELSPEERVNEIARMLSGYAKSEAATAHAKEILKRRGFIV
ncbi:MAG: DNA repair protein RecN [Deltaproteobacteria bacterium]|nr:DNA repair protein RecN [Deltaproteobacteria bacterium]